MTRPDDVGRPGTVDCHSGRAGDAAAPPRPEAAHQRAGGASRASVAMVALRYGDAVLAVLVALLLTEALQPLLETYTMSLFTAAILMVAWRGGLGPGLLATLLSTLAIDYFFLPPIHSLAMARTGDALRLALGLAVGAAASVLCEGLLRARRRAEREAAARALSAARATERETRFRATFKQAAVGIAHVGLDGHWLRVNERLCEIAGYSREELLALTSQDVTHPDDLDADLAQAHRLLAGEIQTYSIEKRYVRKDGSLVWVNLTASLVRRADDSPDYLIAVVEDISARKAAEAERARLAAIVESSEDAIVSKSLDDATIRSWNAGATRLFGYTAEEAVGQPVTLIVPPDRRAEEERILERLRCDEHISPYETVRLRKDGARVDVSISNSPLRDVSGRVVSAACIIRDITERKRVEEELRRARQEAEAANAAKSQFLATMSHEVRTPINAILGYNELLEMGLAGPVTDEQRGYLERVRASGRHLLGVVNEVLDLAKVEAGQMTVERRRGDLRAPVRAALALVRPQAAAKRIALEELAENGDAVYVGDEARVRQILANLLSNAVKFTPAGGRVVVRCAMSEETPAAITPGEESAARTSVEPTSRTDDRAHGGPWAFVRVEDTGVGIPADRLAVIFEPFVQVDASLTRRQGGTGLGLSISRELARLMGGDLVAESRVGEGSAFTLWLPAPATVRAPGGGEGAGSDAQQGATRPALERRRPLPRAALGKLLSAGAVSDIVQTVADRLRADPATEMARDWSQVELEDHLEPFLAVVARAIAIHREDERDGESDGESDADATRLGGDESEIQRVIAECHGAQRRRLGWTEAALRREYEILREELERALRRSAPAGAERALAESLVVIRKLLERTEAISRRGFREARAPERAHAQR